jgi:methylthioxylose transferase
MSPPVQKTVRGDLIAGAAAIGFVLLATAVGFLTGARNYGADLYSRAAPRFGEYPVLADLYPRVGPGTAFAVMIAIATVAWGPSLAENLRWRTLLAAGYATSVAWILALALVDGWQRGIAHQLASGGEYLGVAAKVDSIPRFLDTFTARILDFQPDSWPTHVAGHPPGATLVFVWLDRIGLSGGGAAGIVCVLAGAAVTVAVPATVAALGRQDLARAAVPFVALLPGAIWLGVSADAMFAGVTACGIALFAVGASRGGRALCFAGGAVLGFGIFLSYGLLLMAPIALAVVLVTRNWRALCYAVPGALAVVAVFALAGFWWFAGYDLVVERYHQGIAAHRPYWYWVWANLACLTLAVGPVLAGLRRVDFLTGLRKPAEPVDALVRGATLAVLTATLSGLSKAEVERIWLPFAVWLVLAAVSLPSASRRWWLTAQAGVALVVEHVLLTSW